MRNIKKGSGDSYIVLIIFLKGGNMSDETRVKHFHVVFMGTLLVTLDVQEYC